MVNVITISLPKNKHLLLSATQLAKKITEREIKCLALVEEYIERIKEVQPVINALAEENFDYALKEAIKVDDFLQNETSHPSDILRQKPLLGVPITIKECFAVKDQGHNYEDIRGGARVPRKIWSSKQNIANGVT
ncbi:unnamed protein product [Gordionus sp. m RMFG-2023]